MFEIRKAEERGPADLGWLKSYHTFSFGNYYDPKHMGFSSLKVINEDRVLPGAGFDTHPHANMEIISYVLSGALEHNDSMGNGSVIRPGEVQRLSAGTGITHSEFNHSSDEELHFLQIWFLPDKKNLVPSYEQKTFSNAEKQGTFKLVASKDGRDNSVSLHQDVDMYVAILNSDDNLVYKIKDNRSIWVHVARGKVSVNDHPLKSGDGIGVYQESFLSFDKGENAEVIIFDMNNV